MVKKTEKVVQTLRFRETVGNEKKSPVKQKLDAAESEKLRRNEISKSFDLVKKVVPSIANRDKVSKLMILTEATDYCHSVSYTHLTLPTNREV